MTSDIEQRKAEALKALKNINSPMVPGQTNLDIVLEIKDFLLHYFLLEELLQPSPQVPDSEVDEAKKHLVSRLDELYNKVPQSIRNDFIADMQEIRDWLVGTSCRLPSNRIYPAQHPQREEWLDIKDAPIDGTPHLLAAYIVPSEEAAKHGSKPYWDFGIGRPIYPERTGTNWTGIVGGKPSHFKYLEPPKEK